jgi:hypothetical protein
MPTTWSEEMSYGDHLLIPLRESDGWKVMVKGRDRSLITVVGPLPSKEAALANAKVVVNSLRAQER